MSSIDLCIRQIAAIRRVAVGEEPAYVARSRIGRLAVSTVSLVAKEAGMDAPHLPGPIRLPGTASGPVVSLASSCNRLLELARHLSQPSEPLDARWKKGWMELLDELQTLEELLSRLN